MMRSCLVFATVFRATCLTSGRLCAVKKVVRPVQALGMVRREASILRLVPLLASVDVTCSSALPSVRAMHDAHRGACKRREIPRQNGRPVSTVYGLRKH